MSEDITRDPEYIRGYDEGIKQYRRNHSPYHYGFITGLHALETSETVESKATPSGETVKVNPENNIQDPEHTRKHEEGETIKVNTGDIVTITYRCPPEVKRLIELNDKVLGMNDHLLEEVKQLDERLKKLEKYTQE